LALPQLFWLFGPANAGIAMANIIAAMTSATVTTKSMRLIMRYPLSVKDGALTSPAVLRNRVSLLKNNTWRNFREIV
jgi:hypothetical protein